MTWGPEIGHLAVLFDLEKGSGSSIEDHVHVIGVVAGCIIQKGKEWLLVSE